MISISEKDADFVLRVLREKLEEDSLRCTAIGKDVAEALTAMFGKGAPEECDMVKATEQARKEILEPTEKAIEIMTCGSEKS
jgi:hypothetical protein